MDNLLILTSILFSSFFINLTLIYVSKKSNLFIDDINKSHGSHKFPTPRIGGLGIFIAILIGVFIISNEEGIKLILSSLPIFLIGILEDLKRNIKPQIRILFMSIGAFLSILFLGILVQNITIAELPLVLAVPFTIFALVGITNAINMIDGYNGLASGISLLGLIFIGYLSYKFNDYVILQIVLVTVFSILGFFILNFPKGKIFLGDSGAYTLGFIMGVISLLLLKRHPEVSPWFPVILFAYPVFDVLFAIFRRKFIQKTSPFSPDKLHMHSLIYKHITKNNPLTSMFIISFFIPFCIISLNIYDKDLYLFILFLFFSFVYAFFYFILFSKEEGYKIRNLNFHNLKK